MASISNNSNIPLASGATFNGLYELLSSGVESIQISVKSNEPGVLRVFFAITPLVLLYEKSYTYTAGQYFFVSVPKIAQYFRCNFTNAGPSTQTYFELRTTFNNYLLVDEPTSGTVSSRLLDGAGTAITSTLINSKQGVDVNIANNSTTNDYSRVGLNTYQITPIRKTYQLNGMNNNNVVGIAGGQNTIVDYRTFTFGVAGLAYPIYFNSTNTTRTLIYDYVNSSGNLVENATLTLTANSWIATPNILGVNKWTVTPKFAFNSADVVFMSVTQASTGSIGSKSVSSYMNGIITIPNGYIGYVTNIVSFVSATNNVVLQIWDTNGTRTDAIEFPNTGYYQYSAPYFGGFSGVLTAGMACAFGFENTGTSRNVYCTVILEAI